MNRIRQTYYFVVLFALSFSACQTPETETTIVACASCPEPLSCATAFAYSDGVYVFGGRDADKKCSNRLYRYDCLTDDWTSLGETPLQKRVYPISAVIGDAVYIGLGYNGGSIHKTETSYLRDFWRYTPLTNSWEQLRDYPAQHTNAAVSFVHNGLLYVGFGMGGGFSQKMYSYDPETDTWQEVKQAGNGYTPSRATAAAAGVANGRCFVGTGYRKGSHREWNEFVPENGTWKRCASIPGKGRHNTACCSNTNGIWLFGGWHYGDIEGTGRFYADILLYDTDSDKWSRAGVLPCGETINMVAAAVGGKVYFGLGEDPYEQRRQNFYRLEK